MGEDRRERRTGWEVGGQGDMLALEGGWSRDAAVSRHPSLHPLTMQRRFESRGLLRVAPAKQ